MGIVTVWTPTTDRLLLLRQPAVAGIGLAVVALITLGDLVACRAGSARDAPAAPS